MKSGTTESIKFKKLKRRLGLPQFSVQGVLTAIWGITARDTPAGDIGRHSNEDIAAAIEWSGDADDLVEALVSTGWLDESEEYRLVVHDWHDHCPTYIKGNMAKHGKEFASNSPTKEIAKEPTKQPAKEGARATCSEHPPTKSSQVRASQVQPSQGKDSSSRSNKFDEADMATAEWMDSQLLEANPTRKPPNLKAWANSIRLMRERDKRSDEQIRWLFQWAQADSFWRANILSPEKLRQKWDQLVMKAKTQHARGSPDGDDDPRGNIALANRLLGEVDVES